MKKNDIPQNDINDLCYALESLMESNNLYELNSNLIPIPKGFDSIYIPKESHTLYCNGEKYAKESEQLQVERIAVDNSLTKKKR